MSKEQYNGKIPESVLAKLSEFTENGFILFYSDANGSLRFENRFDNEVAERGLVSFAEDILVQMRETERYTYQIGKSIEQIEENGEGEYDEEDY